MTNNSFSDNNEGSSFVQIKNRLDEIVQLVSDESLPLEEALRYYEEAVNLGLEVSNLLEDGLETNNDTEQSNSDCSN